MGKRRHRSRDSFWTEQYGGMPVWGIASATVCIVVAGVIAVNGAMTKPAVEASELRPLPTMGPAPATPIFEVPDGRALDLFFAGDSLTQGSYTSDASLNFRNRVVSEIETVTSVDASVVGAAGQTVAQAARFEDTMPTSADVSIVEYGTNDVISSTPGQFEKDYAAYLDRVRDASPDSILVCAGTWGDPAATKPFDAIVKSECESRDGIYVRIADLFSKESRRAMTGDTLPDGFVVPDNFHPNDSGHAAIAQRLIGALWD